MGCGIAACYVCRLLPSASSLALFLAVRASRLGWLMERVLVFLMQRDMRPNTAVFEGSGVSVPRALAARSLREWHAAVTCPLRGHATPDDFLAAVSYVHALPRATVPLLFISAEGDPICPAAATPPQATGSVILAHTASGGHISFPGGSWWPLWMSAYDWDTQAALDFCHAALVHGDTASGLPDETTSDHALVKLSESVPRAASADSEEVIEVDPRQLRGASGAATGPDTHFHDLMLRSPTAKLRVRRSSCA